MNLTKSKAYLSSRLLLSTVFLTLAFLSVSAQETTGKKNETEKKPAAVNTTTGKTPIIIIPGLTGSELVNSKNEEVVWFKPQRAKDDDLRLPVTPNIARNRDSLRTGDILRNIQFLKFLPSIEIYEKLIDSLEKRGGYKEGNWDKPAKDGYQDTFYVFPYDWRRDNVENARLLTQRINALKTKLRRPNLKFNVIAHSMGGLIARYAARYGTADLPAGKPRVTWAGAKNFNKIFLLGTPNSGSVEALDSLLNGFSVLGGGLNIPFVQNLSKFDVFTIPSIYQLLPHNGTQTVLDENLKPLNIDYFDIKVWDEYGWNPIADEDFAKKFSPAEVKNARAYLIAALARAKKFQQALDVEIAKSPVPIYLIGGDCKDTLDSVVVYKKKGKWKTLFKADSFETESGTKVSADELKKVIYGKGDGTVSLRSLKGETIENGANAVLTVREGMVFCSEHTKLVTSPESQDRLFALLFNDPSLITDTKTAK